MHNNKDNQDIRPMSMPLSNTQTLPPDVKNMMDKLQAAFGNSLPLMNQSTQKQKGHSEHPKSKSNDDDSQMSEDSNEPHIPDLINLFTEIDIPFTQKNKTLYLTIYLQGLLMIEKQAKRKNIKDLRKDIDYIKTKIEAELKKLDEGGMKEEKETSDFQSPIQEILGKLERVS